jgi:hypothetical protein
VRVLGRRACVCAAWFVLAATNHVAIAREDAAYARSVYADVNARLASMRTVSFVAQQPGVEYKTEVTAAFDGASIRKLTTTGRDDSGDVVTEFYYAKESLVFVFIVVKSFNAQGRLVTAVENRLYFHADRLYKSIGGMDKVEHAVNDAYSQREAREVLGQSNYFVRAAKARALSAPRDRP